MNIESFKKKFDNILQEYMQGKINSAKDIVHNPRIASIIDQINTITFAGWKRIRPYCFYMWYSIYQAQDSKDVRQFATLFELLHTMALIHDDIIDEADRRHNVLTIHKYIQEDKNIPKRVAEWQAILAWDLVLSRVYEVLTNDYVIDKEKIKSAQKTVHAMIQEVVLGQMIDVDLSIGDSASIDTLERKNLYKTARYTFARPLVAGAQLAWAPEDQIKLLRNIGELLGLAYQLRDDLWDILQSHNDKPTFSDIQEGQQTLLTNYIYQHTDTHYKETLKRYMGKQLSKEEINIVKSIFTDSWSIIFARKKIADYIQDASAMIDKITFSDNSTRQYIDELIHKLTTI